MIGPQCYEDYVLEYEKRLIEAIHTNGAKARLHICGDISKVLPLLPQTGVDAVDVDHMVDLADARKSVGGKIALCGNLDPVELILRGTPEQIRKEGVIAAENAAGGPFVLMPGCEVPLATPVANVEAFCNPL